jgi:hypothetical protein
MHNGKNVVHKKKQKSSIDANKRIISNSKDGTKSGCTGNAHTLNAKILPKSLAYATVMALLAQ